MKQAKLSLNKLEQNTGQIPGLPANPREWTQTEIKPGESGTIKASYNNQDGPYPFDKTIKVYFSNYNKPVALHLKGVVGK